MPRDAFCSYCGTAFADRSRYPRRCAACGASTYANPLTVAVVLVPVIDGAREGVLVVRRAVPPGIGKLALVSGFLEIGEPWQVGAAREVREETGVVLDPATLQPGWFTSTRPRPHRILLFASAPAVELAALPPYQDAEVQERGLVYGPAGLDALFVYDFHVEVTARHFAARGITGPAAFARR